MAQTVWWPASRRAEKGREAGQCIERTDDTPLAEAELAMRNGYPAPHGDNRRGTTVDSAQNTICFRAAFPEDTEPPDPPGRGIAEYLADQLRGRGFAVRRFDQYEDVGWSFSCFVSGKRFLVLIYAEAGDADWLVTTHSSAALDLGRLARLLGRTHKGDHQSLNHAIEQILSADARFSEIRWCT